MKPLRVLNTVNEDTQTNLETSSEDESQHGILTFFDPPPEPDPDCTRLYLWISIAVILVASLIVVGILTFFCRRNRDRSSSLHQIITNIELQNPRDSSNVSASSESTPHIQFQAVTRENVKITIVERY